MVLSFSFYFSIAIPCSALPRDDVRSSVYGNLLRITYIARDSIVYFFCYEAYVHKYYVINVSLHSITFDYPFPLDAAIGQVSDDAPDLECCFPSPWSFLEPRREHSERNVPLEIKTDPVQEFIPRSEESSAAKVEASSNRSMIEPSSKPR